jgi:sodium/bile acid cotransporter 7
VILALCCAVSPAGNILGIITSPLAVKVVLGSRTDAHVDSVDLLVKLGVSILMPVLVGKATQELVKPIRDNVAKYKVPLYLINNLQITMIVWQKLSSAREALVEQELGDVLLAGARGAGLRAAAAIGAARCFTLAAVLLQQ